MGAELGPAGGMNYGTGRFAHQNLDFGEPKDIEFNGRHILNALSEIQRYHVIEERSEEIPKEYFTIEQIWDYFKIGFKTGILETFLFYTLLPFLQIVYPSYKYYFLGAELTSNEKLLFDVFSYSSMVITTIFMLYISKYYRGKLTRRAIFALMNGRSLSFLLKGVAIYYLFQWITQKSIENPRAVYSWADWTLWLFQWFKTGVNTQQIYIFYYQFVIPALNDAAITILISMGIFAAFPYFTIFYKGIMQRIKKDNIKVKYENY